MKRARRPAAKAQRRRTRGGRTWARAAASAREVTPWPDVFSVTQTVRIAELNDVARSTEDKEKLAALADTVMTTLDVIVRRTEEQVDTSAETLQSILAVAAEDDGEFLVPLSAEKATS